MLLDRTSISGSDSECAALDAMGACHEACFFSAGKCVPDSAGCILCDAAAEVGRVTLLAEMAD